MEQDFKKWEEEVMAGHWEKEFKGILESVLHLRSIIKYMRSEEAKKYLTDEQGEVWYLEQLRQQEKNLKAREVELEVLKKSAGG